MNDADQIIPHLWLGNASAANNRSAIESHGINVIINCTKDIPFAPIPSIEYKYRVRIDDDLSSKEINNMARALPQILPIIHRHWMAGDRILVHCAMGAQRSAIVVLAYLYRCHGYSISEAYMHIKKRRPIAFFPSMNFRASIMSTQ
jgi:protein-tyrosine phosphatase